MKKNLSTLSEKSLKRVIANAEHDLSQANDDCCAAGRLGYVYNTEMRAVAEGATSIRGMEMTAEHHSIAKTYVAAQDALMFAHREANDRMMNHGDMGPIKIPA